MRASREVVVVALGILAGVLVVPAAAENQRAACSPEVARAQAMVAKAQDAVKAGKGGSTPLARTPLADPGPAAASPGAPGGSGYGGKRTAQGAQRGDPTSGAGRTPLLDQGTGTARGLATSAASDISPWNPVPTDKTLQARTVRARTLTAQAAKLCAAGKTDESRAKALEAIGVLNPK